MMIWLCVCYHQRLHVAEHLAADLRYTKIVAQIKSLVSRLSPRLGLFFLIKYKRIGNTSLVGHSNAM